MTTHHPREFPIILMTGTPGPGKSTHAQYLASASSTADVKFEHINVSELVKEKGFHEGWDEEWKTWIMDEDKVGPAREVNGGRGGRSTGVERLSPHLQGRPSSRPSSQPVRHSTDPPFAPLYSSWIT